MFRSGAFTSRSGTGEGALAEPGTNGKSTKEAASWNTQTGIVDSEIVRASTFPGSYGSRRLPEFRRKAEGAQVTRRQVHAVVTPADKKIGFEKYESRISILRSGGVQLSMHDFSSEDGEHGYGVDGAQWTPDSQYFVCQMRNSGGHSPMYAPVVFWGRKTNHFYQLNDYTADLTFSIAAPDKLHVNSWPRLEPATVSLGAVKEGQVTELR